jgi:hypothetical protein
MRDNNEFLVLTVGLMRAARLVCLWKPPQA